MRPETDNRRHFRGPLALLAVAALVGACSSSGSTPQPTATAATPSQSAAAAASTSPAASAAVSPAPSSGLAAFWASYSTKCTGSPIKIGVDVPLNNTDFWTAWIAYMDKFAQQCNFQQVSSLSNNDPAKEYTNIKTMIDGGVQAIIANPPDSSAIGSSLALAASKKIPVVSVDVAPDQGAGSVYMIVRADNVLYGQESCAYIAEKASHPGTIAILEGNLASLNGLDRTNGCKQVLASKYPNFKVAEYATKWDTTAAVNDAKTAIATYSDLVGIYAEWSAGEDGIIAGLQSANKFFPIGDPNHIIVVGNDGTPHEHDLIRQGTLDATVSQPADLYTALPLIYLRQALAGVTYTAGQTTDHGSTIVALNGNLEDAVPAPLVDKSNVDDPSLWGNSKQP